LRAAFIALAALTLAGCVDSPSPLLTDATNSFGPRLRLQGYALRGGHARDPWQATYQWNGALYAHAGGGLRDISAFSIHPFEAGDFIVQAVPANRAGATEYAVLHKLAEGVYQLNPIDEADADEATRAAFCVKSDKSSCHIETREQLFAFARATAARRKDDGTLILRLPDSPERKPAHRGRRAPRR
jgi:hypothetical protein